MKFKSEKITFELPDTITVRHMLRYRSALSAAQEQTVYERLFRVAADIATDWKCKDIPDPASFDFDQEYSIDVGNIIVFVANETAGYMEGKAKVPKNS